MSERQFRIHDGEVKHQVRDGLLVSLREMAKMNGTPDLQWYPKEEPFLKARLPDQNGGPHDGEWEAVGEAFNAKTHALHFLLWQWMGRNEAPTQRVVDATKEARAIIATFKKRKFKKGQDVKMPWETPAGFQQIIMDAWSRESRELDAEKRRNLRISDTSAATKWLMAGVLATGTALASFMVHAWNTYHAGQTPDSAKEPVPAKVKPLESPGALGSTWERETIRDSYLSRSDTAPGSGAWYGAHESTQATDSFDEKPAAPRMLVEWNGLSESDMFLWDVRLIDGSLWLGDKPREKILDLSSTAETAISKEGDELIITQSTKKRRDDPLSQNSTVSVSIRKDGSVTRIEERANVPTDTPAGLRGKKWSVDMPTLSAEKKEKHIDTFLNKMKAGPVEPEMFAVTKNMLEDRGIAIGMPLAKVTRNGKTETVNLFVGFLVQAKIFFRGDDTVIECSGYPTHSSRNDVMRTETIIRRDGTVDSVTETRANPSAK